MTQKIEEVWGARDEEPWEKAMRDLAQEVERAGKEWAAKWPNHCTKCNGWGGFWFEERHGFSHGAGEMLCDPCDAGEPTMCHRCGEHGMDEDGNGPCKKCGWNCDDGMPEVGL